MLSALFAMIAAESSRTAFGLSRRASLAIAAIAVCAPMFRWTLAIYAFGELLAAMSIMYLAYAVGTAVARQARPGAPLAVGLAAGCVLMYFSGRGAILSPVALTAGIGDVIGIMSPLALFGLPGRTPSAEQATDGLRSAALLILPFAVMFWSTAAYELGRLSAGDRLAASPDDRRLARALIAYAAAAVILGNVAVHADRASAPPPQPAAWRELGQLARMPFRALTLKVDDEPDGLSTALAMYFLPGRNSRVIGRGVPPDQLPFDTVSRQQPMFIQGFGCEGVGHGDVMPAPRVGCLLMEPPSMTLGISYPFNRTFLFMQFDRMTAREQGGRRKMHPTMNLRRTADPQRERLDRELYLNVLVNPFFEAGAEPLRLGLRWGNSRQGGIEVREQQWCSVPVGSSDWSGNRLWTVPVTFDFPDQRTLLFQEVSLTESPPGTVAAPVPAGR
jgi:hypothetical protein